MACAPFLGLAIEEEVAQYPAGAPEEPVGPTLDAALVLVEDEDGPRRDHFAFRINQTASYPRNQSPSCGLEDEQCVTRRLYPARPWRLGPLCAV